MCTIILFKLIALIVSILSFIETQKFVTEHKLHAFLRHFTIVDINNISKI